MAFSHSRPATRHSIFSKTVALAVAALIAGAACVATPVRAADRDTVERGRSQARMILLLHDPRVCAIVLLRDRCRTDVDAFFAHQTDADFAHIPHIGKHPISGLHAFLDDGDREKFDRALGYINSTQAPPALWTTDPHSAALLDAGVTSVSVPGAGPDLLAAIFALAGALDLREHRAKIPAGTLSVAIPAGTSSNALSPQFTSFATHLGASIDASDPPPRLFAAAFGPGPLTDPQLGVALSTVLELIDCPDWLAQADAQRFVSDVVAALEPLGNAAQRAQLTGLVGTLHVGPHFDHQKASLKFSEVTNPILHALPKERGRRIVIGSAAAQLAFNAVVFRDTTMSGAILGALGSATDADSVVPGFAAARAGADAIGSSDWTAQWHLSMTLVGLIRKNGTG